MGTINLSPMVLAGCIWAVTMALLAPILPSAAPFIDYGETQKTFLAISSSIGALACLPAGVSTNTIPVGIFLAIAIVGTSISSMAQNRHLALMIRGASDPFYSKPAGIASPATHFAKRQLIATQISLQATMAEGVGAAAMAALTYYLMGINSEIRLGLWIACIFGGIKWAVGTCQAYFLLPKRRGADKKFFPKQGWTDTFEIRKFPHAITSITIIFLGSWVSSCTFISALLHASGHRCFEPKNILFMWLAYFLAPAALAPVVGLVRRVLMADGRQMQVLGFVLTCGVSALGFIQKSWRPWWTIVGAAVQGLGVGILSSYGRTLFLDFTPPGKEGAFLAWFSFVKGCGLCAGLLMASARAWDIRKALGSSFIASCAALMLLFFGNVGNFSGFLNAGHCKEMIHSERREEEKANLSGNVPGNEKGSGEEQVVELEPDRSIGPSETGYIVERRVDLPAEK